MHLTNLNLRDSMDVTLYTTSGCIFAVKNIIFIWPETILEVLNWSILVPRRVNVLVWFAGNPVLEIWKWCFGLWLSKSNWNRLWWASGSHHSCSVCASISEQERVRLLLPERWWTVVVECFFMRISYLAFFFCFIIAVLHFFLFSMNKV